MSFKNSSVIFISALSMLLASEARAAPVDIAPNSDFPEINANVDKFNTAYPMIASFMMGVWGYNKDKIQNQNLAVTQETLYQDCNKLMLVTSWPSSCTPEAMAGLIKKEYGQNWIVPHYAASKRALALKDQIAAIRIHKSPVVIPLYGHADHWGTIYRMNVENATWTTVYQVRFRDGGNPGADQNNPKPDWYGDAFLDGDQIKTGFQYEQTFYKIVAGGDVDLLDATEPLANRYVFAYDPPEGSRPLPRSPEPVTWERGTALVERGDMTAEMAPMLVWDALEAEGLLSDPALARLSDATPGDGWAVQGRYPSGAAWDYIVVPLYDEEMRGVIALVGLSAEDGSFEQMQYFGRPRVLDLPDDRAAVLLATQQLGRGETLSGGLFTWDPACGAVHCRQPLLPYREFAVRARGVEVARITVPMGGVATRR